MVLPDFTTQDSATYKASIDETVAIHNQVAGAFYVHELSTPTMSVLIDGGYIQNATTLTKVLQQTTLPLGAPAAFDSRIDRVVIDKITGAYTIVAGTASGAPVAPAIPAGKIACAQILIAWNSTAVTNSMITDERPAFQNV